MSPELILGLLTCLVAAAVAILIAAIPCALIFHGRLTRIETLTKIVVKLERRVRALELGRVFLEDEDDGDEEI